MIEEQLGNATEAGKTAIDTTEENTGQMSIDAVLPENTKVSEPILDDNPNRFVLFPIEHDDIWNFYKKSEASFGRQKKSTSRRTSWTGTRSSTTTSVTSSSTSWPSSPLPMALSTKPR